MAGTTRLSGSIARYSILKKGELIVIGNPIATLIRPFISLFKKTAFFFTLQ